MEHRGHLPHLRRPLTGPDRGCPARTGLSRPPYAIPRTFIAAVFGSP